MTSTSQTSSEYLVNSSSEALSEVSTFSEVEAGESFESTYFTKQQDVLLEDLTRYEITSDFDISDSDTSILSSVPNPYEPSIYIGNELISVLDSETGEILPPVYEDNEIVQNGQHYQVVLHTADEAIMVNDQYPIYLDGPWREDSFYWISPTKVLINYGFIYDLENRSPETIRKIVDAIKEHPHGKEYHTSEWKMMAGAEFNISEFQIIPTKNQFVFRYWDKSELQPPFLFIYQWSTDTLREISMPFGKTPSGFLSLQDEDTVLALESSVSEYEEGVEFTPSLYAISLETGEITKKWQLPAQFTKEAIDFAQFEYILSFSEEYVLFREKLLFLKNGEVEEEYPVEIEGKVTALNPEKTLLGVYSGEYSNDTLEKIYDLDTRTIYNFPENRISSYQKGILFDNKGNYYPLTI